LFFIYIFVYWHIACSGVHRPVHHYRRGVPCPRSASPPPPSDEGLHRGRQASWHDDDSYNHRRHCHVSRHTAAVLRCWDDERFNGIYLHTDNILSYIQKYPFNLSMYIYIYNSRLLLYKCSTEGLLVMQAGEYRYVFRNCNVNINKWVHALGARLLVLKLKMIGRGVKKFNIFQSCTESVGGINTELLIC